MHHFAKHLQATSLSLLLTFTFWDYQAGAWQRDHGIRIDFHLLSPQAADRFVGVETHRDARDMDKPSDHVPVWVELDI